MRISVSLDYCCGRSVPIIGYSSMHLRSRCLALEFQASLLLSPISYSKHDVTSKKARSLATCQYHLRKAEKLRKGLTDLQLVLVNLWYLPLIALKARVVDLLMIARDHLCSESITRVLTYPCPHRVCVLNARHSTCRIIHVMYCAITRYACITSDYICLVSTATFCK